jgi:hypothetical protein
MQVFYKYLKSFDLFLIKYAKWLKLASALATILLFVYFLDKNWESFNQISTILRWEDFYWLHFLILLILFIFNHLFDALLWRKILKKVSNIHISLLTCWRMNWKTLSVSIATPGRIGEIPFRRILIDRYAKEKPYSSAIQMFVIKPLSFGFIAILSVSLVNLGWYNALTIPVLVVALILGLHYFLKITYGSLLQFLGINFLRVLSFCAMHFVILDILTAKSLSFYAYLSILLTHSIGSFIPNAMGSEVLLKASIGELLNFDFPFSVFTLSLLLLWVLNIFIPVLVGLFLYRNRD